MVSNIPIFELNPNYLNIFIMNGDIKTVQSYFDDFSELKGGIGRNKIAAMLDMPISTFNHIYKSGNIDFMRFIAIGEKLDFPVLKYFMGNEIETMISNVKKEIEGYEATIKELENKTRQQSELIDVLLEKHRNGKG